MLARGGMATGLDPQRGFDHGTFSLMYPVYPEANMPIVQLALQSGLDPAAHIRVGELIAPLRNEGVVIIGSGFSFHGFMAMRDGTAGASSAAFDRWLDDTLVGASPDERLDRLIHWDDAPAARAAHPREEHLLPLMVAVGAAGGDVGARVYHQPDFMGAITVSSYRFGAALVPSQRTLETT
jgi:aromatic ring-opening dioxygenase catalytic subunit (LigB family)